MNFYAIYLARTNFVALNTLLLIFNHEYQYFLLRALQNYEQVFDFIRRPSSLRFRKRSERHKRAQRSEVEIFPGISKPSYYILKGYGNLT